MEKVKVLISVTGISPQEICFTMVTGIDGSTYTKTFRYFWDQTSVSRSNLLGKVQDEIKRVYNINPEDLDVKYEIVGAEV